MSRKVRKEDIPGPFRARRWGDYVRLADGIITTAAFLVVFALFCSARVGYFLLIALLTAPGISVLWALVVSRFITVRPGEGTGGITVRKNDRVSMDFYVRNRSILIAPIIKIRAADCPGLSAEEKELNISVMGRGTGRVSLFFCTKMAGGAKVGAETVCVEDFFGIARFPIRNLPENLTRLYGIVPDIPELSAREPVLEEAMRCAYGEDNTDESVDIPTYGFAGFPGYDYREYVPGDPLKRINSKLSAKKGELMVRLDEKPVVAGVVFILDTAYPEAEVYGDGQESHETAKVLNAGSGIKTYPEREYTKESREEKIARGVENLTETALGMGRTLISRDFGVTYFWKSEKEWKVSRVRTENELTALVEELSFFSLGSGLFGEERLPGEYGIEGSSIICFTVRDDSGLSSALASCAGAEDGNIQIYNALTGEGRSL